MSARWVLETAPTDSQSWESDWDQLFNVADTSVLSDRATNVFRVGHIGEQLGRWPGGSNNLTFNVGLRYDNQAIIPESDDDFAPRTGFAWDVTGEGRTVVRGGIGRFNAFLPISVDLDLVQRGVITQFPTIFITDPNNPVLQPDLITDSQGNPGVAVLSAAGVAELERRRDAVLAGTTFNTSQPRVDGPRQMPYQWGWSLGVSHQLAADMAVTLDYVANASRDQHGLIDINEPVNGVRPGVAVFDPNGTIIPPEARDARFGRVLQSPSPEELNADYKSFQVGLRERFSNRWGARRLHRPAGQLGGPGQSQQPRVWLDNDIRADYGRFQNDRTHVLAMSASVSPFANFTVAGVLSAISGSPINETTGIDDNGDGDRTDRPIQGVTDGGRPIVSEVDSQGRAVINGIDGPGSFELNVSFRYQVPIQGAFGESLDLFCDIFNLTNRENLVPPTGARNSANFLVPRAARFARQMQFGVRFRF